MTSWASKLRAWNQRRRLRRELLHLGQQARRSRDWQRQALASLASTSADPRLASGLGAARATTGFLPALCARLARRFLTPEREFRLVMLAFRLSIPRWCDARLSRYFGRLTASSAGASTARASGSPGTTNSARRWPVTRG